MKNCLLVLFFLSCITTSAQSLDLLFGACLSSQKGNVLVSAYPGDPQKSYVTLIDEIDETVKLPCIGLSYYYPFYPESGNISVGGVAGFTFFASYSSNESQNLYGQSLGVKSTPLFLGYTLPLLAMCRAGSAAFVDNTEGVGGGLGFGMSLNGFTMPYEKGFLASPVLCAEARWKKFGLRVDYSLKKYKSYYKTDLGDLPRMTTGFVWVTGVVSLLDD